MAGMDHGAVPSAGGHGMGAMDLNDVAFDAFLINDRDLSDPEVVPVERGGRVRLRIINAAASTNFWIDLGSATGALVAVDGRAVQPVRGQRVEIAMAQRLDIELDVPSVAVALPILAQREGDRARTGLILAAPGAQVERVAADSGSIAPPVVLALERKLVAAEALTERAPDRWLATDLTGSMAPYAWSLDGRGFADRVPLEVREHEAEGDAEQRVDGEKACVADHPRAVVPLIEVKVRRLRRRRLAPADDGPADEDSDP
jgi:FtsP/CotA-like multicopper oxidase with cupredoxin domain